MLTIYPDSVDNHSVELEEILREIQLIAAPWESGYLVGSRFMQHISFVGCMPFLRTVPEEGEQICYVELPEITVVPQLFVSKAARKPRCRNCSKLVVQKGDDRYQCDSCGEQWMAHQLNWGSRMSCWTRQRINLHQIVKGDAAPSEEFLQLLQSKTGFSWSFCFL